MSEVSKRNLNLYMKMAKRASELFGLGAEVELIGNGENVTYKLTFQKEDYSLRLTEESHRSQAQVLAELDWVSYLAKNNLGVSKPKKSLGGLRCIPLEEEGVTCFASVFQWAPGSLFEAKTNLNKEFIRAYGKLLARLHSLTKKYKVSPRLEKRKRWKDSIHVTKAPELIEKLNPKMLEHWFSAKSWYDTLPTCNNSYALNHMDLHTGNFHIEDNTRFTLFDFDDSAYSFFTYDIVVPLMTLFSVQTTEWPYPKIEEIFLEAYLAENSLESIWIDRIPSFVRLRNIEMYSWIELRYGEGKSTRHLEYLKKVEDFMEQNFEFV